ncbi:M15 family metallopeptidase [Neptunomonas marina]|uniref:M15 family peptidase n=1 Tax=Neptunomonas marina TaxID=1815562 RepID=A0A437QDZ1_9GAMM|nr:M15 family metallopeptidase [Neptunomonas marina]RVU32706.1 M15 family peptidase [Neptunomonas marina]
MSYKLGKRSRERLEGVHPDLVRVVERAIQKTSVDFTVLEGVRSIDRQRKLLAAGSSTTLRSRHLTGHAVDLGAWVDGQVDWSWPLYYEIAEAMFAAAQELGIPLEWGGNWASLKDGPHYQLSWASYPAERNVA